jgi:hypothetical protein
MKLITFLILTACSFGFTILAVAQQTYIVKGFVIDSLSNKAVKDAQVWLYGKQAGDITDIHGQYEFKVFKTYSNTRMYVRTCDDKIASSVLVSFEADTLIKVDFSMNGIENDCYKPTNIPWKVSPLEYVNYEGFIILDIHGNFFKTCSNNSYLLVWPEDFNTTELWSIESQVGDSLFIQVKGRLDLYSKDAIPSQSLLIGEIVTLRKPRSLDCEMK